MGRYIDPSKPMVALTFDDGPSAHTARILDCLEANDARATFYMVGNRMGTYQSTVKRMVDMGCEPGSHTWDHTYITKLSQEGLFANLNRLDDTLQSIAGVRTVTMRPPGGFVSDNAKQNLGKEGRSRHSLVHRHPGLEDEKCPEYHQCGVKQRKGW